MQKFKKLGLILTVFACVFAVAGLAFAENRVEVKVTSEPIPDKSKCSKAGGFSMEFDEGTELIDGDRITIDLDFGVKLCRSIDIVIAPAGSNVLFDLDRNLFRNYDMAGVAPTFGDQIPFDDGSVAGIAADVWMGASIPVQGLSGNSVTQTVAGVVGPPTVGGEGAFFHVYGSNGSQRITVDVIGINPGDGTSGLRVNDVTSDKDAMILRFLDANVRADVFERNNEMIVWWDQNNDDIQPVDGSENQTVIPYTNGIEMADNTLCINVSEFDETKVFASLDSQSDKFTFIPSNPQIAHIAPTSKLFSCKDGSTSRIQMASDQGRCIFDFENGLGYCDASANITRRVVISRPEAFSDSQYRVTMTITSPSTGVYWSNDAIRYTAMTSAACPTNPAGNNVFGNTINYTYLNSGGAILTNFNGDSGSCSGIADADKAVTVQTEGDTGVRLFPAGTGQFNALYLDIPNMVFDKDVVTEGTEVKVQVSLSQLPCGEIYSGEIVMGTFGCGTSTTMVYPYFTGGDGAWWNGVSVTNISETAGTAGFYLFEQDGDQAKLENVAVGANSGYVNLLSSVVGEMTQTAGTGTIGDSTAYIVVCTDFDADGFAMIANNDDGVNGGESMGYIPRIDPPDFDFCADK